MTAEPVYIDSSALVKLVLDGPESAALRDFVAQGPALVTSRLASVEVLRAARGANPEAEASARSVTEGCLQVAVDDDVLDEAGRRADRQLRTLDAVHLASALRVRARSIVVYDRRLADAASAAGLAVLQPGLSG